MNETAQTLSSNWKKSLNEVAFPTKIALNLYIQQVTRTFRGQRNRAPADPPT